MALEAAVHEAGGVAGLVRARAEWESLDVCRIVRSEPLVEITRIGDAPPMPMPQGGRPLGGVRVLDLIGPDGQRPAVLATAPVITSGGDKHGPVRTVGE